MRSFTLHPVVHAATAGAVVLSLATAPLQAQRGAIATAAVTAAPSGDSAATSFVHESWTVENGLPVNAIQRVTRAADGYLWLATWDGLVRFDGVRFTVFNSGNTSGLPSNRIADMTAAPDGSLWLRTEQNHLVRARNGSFVEFTEARGIPERSARTVFVDSLGVVLVGSQRGLYALENDRFVQVAPSALQGEVTAVLREPDGTIWAGTKQAGLYRIENQRVIRFEGQPLDTLTGWISAIRRDRQGAMYVGTRGGLFRVQNASLIPVRTSTGRPLSQLVTDLRLSPRGELWVATESGLYVVRENRVQPVFETPGRVSSPGVRFDATGMAWYAAADRLYRDGRVIFALNNEGQGQDRFYKQIEDFHWDDEGSLWVGTYQNGLIRLKSSSFEVYSTREGVSERNVTTLLEDTNEHLWIGTLGGGLNRLANGQVTQFASQRRFPPFVLSLLQTTDGALWVGTLQQGIRHCQLPELLCSDPPGGQPLLGATIRALHQDASGAVWAGTESGLFRWRDGVWTPMAIDNEGPPGTVRGFLESTDGTLFMSSNGAGILAHRGGRFSRIGAAQGLPSNLVRALHLDADETLWVGTEGRGLARLRVQVQPDNAVSVVSVDSIGQRDGLFDEVIHQILPDSLGRLWMSSNRGIFWVTLEQLNAVADGRARRLHSTAYTERDGLRNREANGGQSPVGITSRDGRLWFATQDGAVVVDPARTGNNTVPPVLRVEALTTSLRALRTNDGVITLQADEREFEIEYTALSFLAPENVQFRYRLKGLTDDWTEAGNRRTAFYTNVPPGRYTFQVRASNNDGVWNDPGSAIELEVQPWFHETPAAYLLLALTLGALAALAVRWRLQSLRDRERELSALVDSRTSELRRNEALLAAQNAELEALHQSRSQLFANLSHEFRTPLTLVLGPLNSVLDGRFGALPDEARVQGHLIRRNAERLLTLINRILDLSRIEAGGLVLDFKPRDLVALARITLQSFRGLAAEQSVQLQFTAPEEPLWVAVDDEQFEKILLNLLSNAFKFTPDGGSVEVVVARRNDRAVIEVHDSGIGIADEHRARLFDRFYQVDAATTERYEGSGIGLALVKELVELHGGQIAVASVLGAGSVFTVQLPFSASAAQAVEQPFEEATKHPGDDPELADLTTVLVIDDSADMRAYVRSLLTPTYRVLEASDGKAGLQCALSELPDLVIADVMMPHMDGLAMCRALRADPMAGDIPVVLLTARSTPGDQIEGLHTGAEAYLTKPFNAGVLEACVQNLLAQRHRLRDRLLSGDITPPVVAVETPHPLDSKLRPLIEANLHDASFGAPTLAAAAAMSYHQLYRALKEDLAVTPTRYIRSVRVEIAAAMLRDGSGGVTQVAYAVGFDSLSYFRRAFRERYGVSPSEYLVSETIAGT